MKLYLLFIILIFASGISAQPHFKKEKEYSVYIQSLIGGQREVSVQSGRVDLLTDKEAIEIEWARKWKEAIGQSIWYALQTNKEPAIILIMKSSKDYKYFIQLNSALTYAGLENKVKVYLYPQDFQELIDTQN